MDVEELVIQEQGEMWFPVTNYVYLDGKILGYRFSSENRGPYRYEWKCIYDGVVFIGGKFGMIELTTGFFAVFDSEVKGKITPQKCMEVLKSKLSIHGKSIHEVIRINKTRNLDLETWVIKLLCI